MRPCLKRTEGEWEGDSEDPHPLSILDCRFWIVGPRVGNSLRENHLHLLLGNLKSKIENPKCYLITLSARYSIDCGIVRPICLAVLRFITNSNLVGCSTGKSAGLAPFRIRSTK